MENEVPADCILMNIKFQFVLLHFLKQGKAKPQQGLAEWIGKQWRELKQTQSVGLKNKMTFSIAAMLTFVFHNHTAS